MRDVERLLADSLGSIGRTHRPSDVYSAQQEFLLRRRRRRTYRTAAGVVVAGAAAALAFALVQTNPFRDEVTKKTRPALAVATTFGVGDEPSGVFARDDHVWVANQEDGTVTVINVVKNRIHATVDIHAPTDDVVVEDDALWATRPEDGTVAVVRGTHVVPGGPKGKAMLTTVRVGEPGRHIDIAAGLDAVWAVTRGENVYRLEGDDAEKTRLQIATDPSDVAVGQGYVWILDAKPFRPQPRLLKSDGSVIAFDPLDQEVVHRLPALVGQHGDLAVDSKFVWVANGDEGTITRINPTTGGSAILSIDGPYIGIASGTDYLWAVSFGDGDTGTLSRIDKEEVRVAGEPLELDGGAADVAVDERSAWVTNNAVDTVTRVKLVKP